MKQYTQLILASCLAVVLAIGLTVRVASQKSHFDRTVREALRTSEGYDQKFIDMVNRLEDELATRASFGYTGGKDPMTGITRQVVLPKSVAPRVKTGRGPATPEPAAPAPVAAAPDPVKLTAIIGDAKKNTAIVMDGERSYSVEAGDKVAGRKITRVTNEGIYMEDDTLYYFYDISGNRGTKKKDWNAPAPAQPQGDLRQ